ncbi:MAG TPA: HAMP domain-containing sensor histidine kinase, partial [Dehalococcoidia bacterium]|nr:HAMP domain-containing sensor histidine kinase [Dehalococcoidia bacterium]
ELRTPLTSLRGYLDVTRRRLQRQAPAESVAAGLEVASRQVGRLTRLVDELLDASRLTRGQFVIEPRSLDLLPFVRGVVEADRLAAQTSHDVLISADVAELWGSADADRLEQVLLNLLSNARKYSPAERPIEVTVAEEAGMAVISVRDSGVGIPEVDQPRIFEPFYRASNVDRGLTGFGLGLYVAREIVRAHGGSLGVRSQPGAGATFTLTLPLGAEAEQASV